MDSYWCAWYWPYPLFIYALDTPSLLPKPLNLVLMHTLPVWDSTNIPPVYCPHTSQCCQYLIVLSLYPQAAKIKPLVVPKRASRQSDPFWPRGAFIPLSHFWTPMTYLSIKNVMTGPQPQQSLSLDIGHAPQPRASSPCYSPPFRAILTRKTQCIAQDRNVTSILS